ncbi:Piso0_005380 [Millerozyma farinosa CBS 7064]|uniref:Piso0_005380 protein n=1 Tax=Pichia sorbitophila (strain ATCC MYA-4447 / BCRC 22081 / CBS 7064 / NBRC 10061 / NRRL Y-12695) TaxID=559304 RepID=G8Y4Y5_PICSO|nr:Piso0_005380 [Millerozyma farinosa CBS 7064]
MMYKEDTLQDVSRRKRVSLVCLNCKRKKVKCDKGRPCNQCKRSNLLDKCVYNYTEEESGADELPPYIQSIRRPISLNESKRSSTSSTSSSSEPQKRQKKTSPVETPSIGDEINNLKLKITQLESSLRSSNQSDRSTHSSRSPALYNSDPYVGSTLGYIPDVVSPSSVQSPPEYDRNAYTRHKLGITSPYNFQTKINGVQDLREMNSAVSCRFAFSGSFPYNSPDDTINFYENYTSLHVQEPIRRVNFGPFAWSSLMKKDLGLSLLWDYVIAKKLKSKDNNPSVVFSQPLHELTQENTNAITSCFDESRQDSREKAFQKRALQTDGYEEMVPYNSILKAKTNESKNFVTLLNEKKLSLGLTFYDGQLNQELLLIDKIQAILPKKRIIWHLFEIFFERLYPYFPFLDESCFTKEVERILGPKSFEDIDIKQLKIEKRLDLAIIGNLLVVLRLSYLSLFCNKTDVNEAKLHTNSTSDEALLCKYLLSNPINITTIDVAHLCLQQFQFLRIGSLPVLQLMLYLRLYHSFAPEDGDGADGGDSQILNALLVRMAYSLGLNREPDLFPDVLNEPRLNHLGRKIWHYVALSDLHLGFSFGSPLCVDMEYSDTNPPSLENSAVGPMHEKREASVVNTLYGFFSFSSELRDMMKKILNVRRRLSMPELSSFLSSFEIKMFDKYGKIDEFLKPIDSTDFESTYEKNLKVKSYLGFLAYLISIVFHLYLYYDAKVCNLSFFYLKKIVSYTIVNTMPYYFDLLGNSDVICDFITNPSLESIIHKSNQINIACIIKLNFQIYHMSQSSEHHHKMISDPAYLRYFKALCRLSCSFLRCTELGIAAISKISNRYYYAWRITKGHLYLLESISSSDFYVNNYDKATSIIRRGFELGEMEELIGMCESSLSKMGVKAVLNIQFYKEYCPMFFKERPDSSNEGKMVICKHLEDPSNSMLFEFSNYYVCSRLDAPYFESYQDKVKGFQPDCINNADIDNVWLSFLSMKHDNIMEARPTSNTNNMTNGDSSSSTPFGYGNNVNNVNDNKLDPGFSLTPETSGPDGVNLSKFTLEQALNFDIFSELPLDHVFSTIT